MSQICFTGLAASFLFTIGALGFILLDQPDDTAGKPKINRLLITSIGFLAVLISFFTTWVNNINHLKNKLCQLIIKKSISRLLWKSNCPDIWQTNVFKTNYCIIQNKPSHSITYYILNKEAKLSQFMNKIFPICI